MKDNKPWYEKVSIWITIIAGICAILGISIFGDKSLFNNNTDETSIDFENNEIEMGDQSAIIIGDNNTFNYGTTDSNAIQPSGVDEFSVTATYDMNTFQSSSSGIDVMINATTSLPAEHVTITAVSDTKEYEPFDMHGGTCDWYFRANFFEEGNYTITVTAYDFDGAIESDEFTFKY